VTGKVQGTTCNGTLVGVPAFIQLNLASNPDIGYSVKAGNDGSYAYWLPKGRYEVIVAKDNWVPQIRRVQVQAGFVLTSDFALRPWSPCNPAPSGI